MAHEVVTLEQIETNERRKVTGRDRQGERRKPPTLRRIGQDRAIPLAAFAGTNASGCGWRGEKGTDVLSACEKPLSAVEAGILILRSRSADKTNVP